MKNIAIDFVTHDAGEGGGGGGIWTVAKNLIIELDKIHNRNNNLNIICFVKSDFVINCKNLKLVYINYNINSILKRLIYVHVILPFLCLYYKIDILQKLATEVPIFNFCKVAVIVHDFMAEFYWEMKYYGIRDSFFIKIKIYYFLFITKLAINKASFIITPSRCIANELLLRYKHVKIEKVYSFHNGVELTSFNEPIKTKDDFQTINIYCIAGFFPHKGHLKTIEIFEELILRYDINAKLYFRGNTNDPIFFEKIQKRIAVSSCKEKITIIKYNKKDTLPDIYRPCDFIILLSEYEGFGLPILEAQYFNVPVICSDIPVFREIAGDGAIFVNQFNIKDAASEIFQFINNPMLIKKTIIAAKKNCQLFTWKNFAKNMYNLYNSFNLLDKS